jgi:hypothetical protein
MSSNVGLAILATAWAGTAQAQDILFQDTPGAAEEQYALEVPVRIGHCTDSLRVDTVYMEDPHTGRSEMSVQTYPLARYEFYTDGALYRRIDVRHEVRRSGIDRDLKVGQVDTVSSHTSSVPNGAYHEFFPNGNIRVMGQLDGYEADGTLKRTGEWREWDANGHVIRRDIFPE